MNNQATVEMTDDDMSDDEQQAADKAQQEELLQGLGSKLHRLAQEQVTAKQQIELRWLQDLRQYHGDYTPEEVHRMQTADSSQVYVNITRNKTRLGISRMSDMVLPNDDSNFGLTPTPVPATAKSQLSQGIEQAQAPMKPQGGAGQMGDPMAGELPEPQAEPEIDPNDPDAIKEAAEAMQEQIEDDFSEARYNAHARDLIDDACKMGTGILKGPTIVNRTRRAWITNPETGKSEMEVQEELRPGLEHVDPWDFFPDMSACSPEEMEFVFERKLLNRKQLRDLSDLPGVMLDQLRRSLEDEDGHHISQDRRNDLREITGVDTVTNDKRWELWEYWGPIDKDELRSCGCNDVDDDPLIEYTGVVLMVGPHVIKAAINPLDTGDLPYSVFNWEEDRASIFGFGIPYLLRHPQRIVNAAWRMMMDNAGLSAGPQIVINKRAVTPQDGDWTVRPRKVWFATGDKPVEDAFRTFDIRSNQGDLFAIYEAAKALGDTETSLPLMLQGEGTPGGQGANTAFGLNMLMNNSNIVLRTAVKNFDDGITNPTVRRFYDFHMIYTDRSDIKGDFDIVARGSSVLIAREEMQEKLMILAQVAAGNETFARQTDWDGLYREILRAMQVPVDTIIKSDEQIKKDAEQSGQQQDPEVVKAQADAQHKSQELQLKAQELQMRDRENTANFELKTQQQQFEQEFKAAELQTRQERERAELALKQGLTMAELEGKLGLESQKLENKMQETTAKLQTDRDIAAARLREEQNDRIAREQNQRMGFDSYG